MGFIQGTKVSLAFADRIILDDVSINLNEKSRCALCGANGCGKTTLLKVIKGIIPAESGSLVYSKEVQIGYLPQSEIVNSENSLFDEALLSFSLIEQWIEKKEGFERQLSIPGLSPKKIEEYSHLIHDLQEAILNSGYYSKEKQIELILKGLGFSPSDYTKKCSQFSGGWQMRIALAKILLQKTDFLLLDEPTNYLDIEAREWLKQFIKNYNGGVLLISHDRHFLDETVSEVMELFLGKLKRYKGNYSHYEKVREEELTQLITAYEQQQEELEKAELFIRKFRATATKASAVQSRIKQVEKMERVVIPENLKKIHFHFPPPPPCGEKVLEVVDLEKKFGTHQVLGNFSYVFKKGMKTAITGVNGAGKTTLLKILAGKDSDFGGKRIEGSNLKVGYFAQDSGDTLSPSLSAYEEIEKDSPVSEIPRLRGLLGAFLFSGDDIDKPISVLSGGERNRLSLLKILLKPANLLILDEPTNHLDLHSKDVLLKALLDYDGTLLFVSHDRYFLEKLAQSVIELTPQGAQLYPGDYSYYLYRKACQTQEGSLLATKTESVEKKSSGSADYQKNKEYKSRLRKAQKEEEDLMSSIEEVESQLSQIDHQLSLEENYSNPERGVELTTQRTKLEHRLTQLTEQWETAAQKVERLIEEGKEFIG